MFHYTKAVCRVGLQLFWFCFSTSRKWAKHLEKYPPELRFSRFQSLSKKMSDALNVDLVVFGQENLPKDCNYFLVCNHMSAYDPIPVIITVNSPTSFVGKMELEKVPLLRTAMKALEIKCIDRDNLRQSLKVMMSVEEELRTGKRNWMIFPEGTRIRDQLLPLNDFHHGTFRPAQKAKVPIVPVAMYGSFRVLKLKPQFKRYPIFVTFLKPIMPEDYAKLTTLDLAEMTRAAIQKEITSHLRPLDHKTMMENKEKAYHHDMIIK